MLIDAHLDLAYNVVNLGRDLRVTVTEGRLRAAENSDNWRENAGTLTTTFPEIRANAPAVVCGTIFILPHDATTTLDGRSYHTPAEARDQAWEQMRWYHDMADSGHCRLVTTRAQLDAVCDEAPPYGAPGVVMVMEGADGLTTPADLGEWYAAGLRWLGLSWLSLAFHARCPGGSRPRRRRFSPRRCTRLAGQPTPADALRGAARPENSCCSV